MSGVASPKPMAPESVSIFTITYSSTGFGLCGVILLSLSHSLFVPALTREV